MEERESLIFDASRGGKPVRTTTLPREKISTRRA
jgi:hypothetical protein